MSIFAEKLRYAWILQIQFCRLVKDSYKFQIANNYNFRKIDMSTRYKLWLVIKVERCTKKDCMHMLEKGVECLMWCRPLLQFSLYLELEIEKFLCKNGQRNSIESLRPRTRTSAATAATGKRTSQSWSRVLQTRLRRPRRCSTCPTWTTGEKTSRKFVKEKVKRLLYCKFLTIFFQRIKLRKIHTNFPITTRKVLET